MNALAFFPLEARLKVNKKVMSFLYMAAGRNCPVLTHCIVCPGSSLQCIALGNF